MNEIRFDGLLRGSEPSMQDFIGFVSVIEKLPAELLWKLVNEYPSMQWILKKTALSSLQDAVQKQNVDDVLNAIVTRLMQK